MLSKVLAQRMNADIVVSGSLVCILMEFTKVSENVKKTEIDQLIENSMINNYRKNKVHLQLFMIE